MGPPGDLLEALRAVLKPLGAHLRPVGGSKDQLEACWSALGAVFRPRALLGPSEALLEALGAILKPLGTLLGRAGGLLERS